MGFNAIATAAALFGLAFTPNYDEDQVPDYTLPDPLVMENGDTVESAEDWFERRRPEVLGLFREHVYGHRPGPPESVEFDVVEEDPEAMEGAATLKRVNIRSLHGEGEHAFELILFIPNDAPEPVPAFMLMNNRGPENTDPTREELSGFWPAEDVIERGYAVAAFRVSDVAPDSAGSFREAAMSLFEDPEEDRTPNGWGALAAWGWGASRAMDYFETDGAVDASRIALLGHSRGGKASLWGGAEDERFAIVISNNSGCGGAAISRRRFGETVARINENFPHWFCLNFREYDGRENALPVDQHMLVALMAPRPVYVASAEDDGWADPRGEFLAAYHAGPVFSLVGETPLPADDMPEPGEPAHGTVGYHIREGGHNLTPEDWGYYMDFADTHFGR